MRVNIIYNLFRFCKLNYLIVFHSFLGTFNMAIRGNQMLPGNHFHKHWQRRIKTWFNQAARKYRRRQNRITKAKAVAPRPAGGLLRPAVRCASNKHNTRVRLGRGFTLQELKAAGVSVVDARAFGVAVDFRRTNLSVESLQVSILYNLFVVN